MRIFMVMVLGWFLNCSSLPKNEVSLVDDYEICEEENVRDCKYQFENY